MQSSTELPHACFSLAISIQVILVLVELVWCLKGWRVQAVVVHVRDYQHSSPVLWRGWLIHLNKAMMENFVLSVEKETTICADGI